MSDHWEYYPRTIDDFQASVFVNLGIREEINSLALPSLLKIHLTLRTPNENGLPTNGEADLLFAFEDDLSAKVESFGGCYVGRITACGIRIYYFYVAIAENLVKPDLEELSGRHGYELGYDLTDDPSKAEYWLVLHPDKYEWLALMDLKVIQSLQGAGDTLEEERDICHYARFKDIEGMLAFRTWTKMNGFTDSKIHEPNVDSDSYTLVFHHNCVPRLCDISPVTILLTDKAEEYGGEYDGWETAVIRTAH
jgi:hypothetical protein